MLGRTALQACRPPARQPQALASIFGAIRTNVTEASPPPKPRIPVLDLFGDLQIPLPPSRTYMKDDVGPAGARLGQDQFAGRGAMSRNLLQKKAAEVVRTTQARPRVRPAPAARPKDSAPQSREERSPRSSDRPRQSNLELLDSDLEADLMPDFEDIMGTLEVIEQRDVEPEPLPCSIDYVQTDLPGLFTNISYAPAYDHGLADVLEDDEETDLLEIDEDDDTGEADIELEEPVQQQIMPSISLRSLTGVYSDFLPAKVSKVYGETMKKVGPIGYAALVLAKESSVNLRRKKRALDIVSKLARARSNLGGRAKGSIPATAVAAKSAPAKAAVARSAPAKAALGKPKQQRVAAR